MFSSMPAYVAVYIGGVLIGLMVMRDRWPARLATAVAWPLGPFAFVVVLAILLAASVLLWPLPVLTAAAVLGALGWWLT
jgi:hypothetical protein